MRRRSGVFIAATAIGAGLIALTLLPGTGEQRSEAEEGLAAVTSSVAPNPELLRQLDFEVSAPPARTEPVKVATLQPAGVMPPATGVAGPAAATPVPPTPASFVGATAVNMRSGPSTASGTISVLQPGQVVQTGQTSGGWVQVTLTDGTTGWVYGTYLSGGAPQAATTDLTDNPPPKRVATIAQPRAVIHGDAADLEDRTARIASSLTAHSRPLDSAPSIFTLQPGDRVRIAEVRGNWLKVQTPDGVTGWIRRAD
jgi:SH3-like domain-containing protein